MDSTATRAGSSQNGISSATGGEGLCSAQHPYRIERSATATMASSPVRSAEPSSRMAF